MVFMSKVRLEKISKIFGGQIQAVCAVDLEVKAGETMVLAGPSGAGKSTILRLIAGLENATSGDIYIDDEPVNN